ncbi:MAG TPA: pilin [Burkholderiales bacterium]|jgi:type IV pilus assembly protein PilA
MRRGFTLIEMMVVLAIIAILALMAYPTYQDKFVRDQINEALPLADLAKAPVAASWMLMKTLPADNAAAGLPPPEKIVSNLVSSVALEGGAIHITFGNRAAAALKGQVLTLRPAVVDDAQIVPVAWVCASASVPGNMVARGVNRTTIPSPYLPGKCR